MHASQVATTFQLATGDMLFDPQCEKHIGNAGKLKLLQSRADYERKFAPRASTELVKVLPIVHLDREAVPVNI